MADSQRKRYSRSPSPQRSRTKSRSRSRSWSQEKHRSRSRSRSRSGARSRGRDDAVNTGNTLFVTGLSSRVTERDLEEHFSKEGKVSSLFLVVEPRTRISRGFAFVTMDTVEDADQCVKYLNQSVLEGRYITVEKDIVEVEVDTEVGTDAMTMTTGGLRGGRLIEVLVAFLLLAVHLMLVGQSGGGQGHTLHILRAQTEDMGVVPMSTQDEMLLGACFMAKDRFIVTGNTQSFELGAFRDCGSFVVEPAAVAVVKYWVVMVFYFFSYPACVDAFA